MMAPVRITGASWDERVRYAREIKPARLALRMTQRQLAEAAGVSLKTIGNLESGSAAPQEDVLRRIFSVLGIKTDADEQDPDITAWMEMFGRLLAQVPEERRFAAANRIIDTLMAEIITTRDDLAHAAKKRDEEPQPDTDTP